MSENTHQFFMCPPFEIVGRETLPVVARRGHFEISNNKIMYKLANENIDFLILKPFEGIGMLKDIPFDINAYQLLHAITKGLTELCILSDGHLNKSFILDFIYGDLLPFFNNKFPSGFYKLTKLHPNVFEEFYRLTESLEDSITTTIATFDENVFIPFKQKVIGAYHTDDDKKEDKATMALDIISREFPRFINMHQNLQTILNSQAKQIIDHQQLSYTILNPFIRKIRMINIIKEYLTLEEKKNGVEMKLTPITLETSHIAEKLTPLVKPR